MSHDYANKLRTIIVPCEYRDTMGILTFMNGPVVVAIDGPAGAGKSTVARGVANRLGVVYIDSGAMYRAVGLLAIRSSTDLDDALKLEQLARHASIEFTAGENRVLLNGEDVTLAIRDAEVADAASRVAAVPGVRRAMVQEQRRIAQDRSVVMEGRDIGSVVFPDAQVKIFLDADPTVRVERRALELESKGRATDRAALGQEMAVRDHRDQTRAESPLIQAPDAEYLDTTGMSQGEVEEAILRLIRKKTSNGKGMTH